MSWSTSELKVRLVSWNKFLLWVFLLLVLVFAMLACLFFAALWSPVGKVLTSWLSCVWCFLVFVTFSCGVLGHLWYLIVSILDLCLFNYFEYFANEMYLRHTVALATILSNAVWCCPHCRWSLLYVFFLLSFLVLESPCVLHVYI